MTVYRVALGGREGKPILIVRRKRLRAVWPAAYRIGRKAIEDAGLLANREPYESLLVLRRYVGGHAYIDLGAAGYIQITEEGNHVG